MQTSCPIDRIIAFAPIQTSGAFHATTRTDSAELEHAVEDGTIIANVIFALLFLIRLHVVWGDLLEEVDVLVCMELGHLMARRRLGSLWGVNRYSVDSSA